MIDKIVPTFQSALQGIKDGASILVSGFGNAGSPIELLEALIDQGATDLTVVSNNGGEGNFGLAALMASGRVRKIICSYPRSAGSVVFEDLFAAGRMELEVVPQGTLSERMRAAGAGIAASTARHRQAHNWDTAKRFDPSAAVNMYLSSLLVSVRGLYESDESVIRRPLLKS